MKEMEEGENEKQKKTGKPRIGLTSKIFLGLILGALFGAISPHYGEMMKPFGDMFIRMIKMIVVPLIFSSLVMGIAGTGDFKKLGRLGAKALIWFEAATTVALFVGLFIVNVVKPGAGVNVPVSTDASSVTAAAGKHIDMMQMIVNIVPTNIVDTMAKQDMLAIIFFACFFGVAAAAIGKAGEPVVKLCGTVTEVMFKVTHYVMALAPIGVFALIAYTVAKFGLAMLIPLAKLIGTLYLSLVVFLALIVLFASLVCRINFYHVLRAIKDPLLLAFSTASSEAALPIAMEKLQKFGIPKHIVTFVMPTGYSFNLDGSTLYSSLAVVFISQMYNIDFPLSAQILMVLTLMLSTKGIAGVPGASIIVIAGTVAAFGLPVEGVAIILGVDRVMDMARTCCNVFGNCIATVVVARWENEITSDDLELAYSRTYED